MPKLLDMQLWGRYANVYAMYEVVPINDVAKNHCTQMMITMTQYDDGKDATAQLNILSWQLGQISQ